MYKTAHGSHGGRIQEILPFSFRLCYSKITMMSPYNSIPGPRSEMIVSVIVKEFSLINYGTFPSPSS